ncbi:hypothetical protein FDK13_02110 [Dyadobacter frigoris]|uniref:Uncharacterized protein n=2 Tax=Dyadobacter frigoris TaxID=2576211 RepID=A0A4U6DDG1_9BACT|nr:hypothetical protein FDK13_02110 [Dyadobacter frigoris]
MRPQDIVVLLAIIAIEQKDWNKKSGLRFMHKEIQNKDLADSLKISSAEISASLYRSSFSGLIDKNSYKKVFAQSLLDFIKFGIKYVFPVQPGPLVRGVPTAHSAQPLKSQLSFQEEMVWEDAEGTVRGQSIIPLYSSVPLAVKNNPLLYELLALTDSVRIGGARERELAIAELEKRFFQ